MQAIGKSRAVIAPSLQDFLFVRGLFISCIIHSLLCWFQKSHPCTRHKGERQNRVLAVPWVQVTTECHLQGKESWKSMGTLPIQSAGWDTWHWFHFHCAAKSEKLLFHKVKERYFNPSDFFLSLLFFPLSLSAFFFFLFFPPFRFTGPFCFYSLQTANVIVGIP